MRAFLPNERSWVFRWIFNIVIPKILQSCILSQKKAIIADDCFQEFMQIDVSQEICFNNTICIGCGHHLVRMSWTHHVIKTNFFPDHLGH